MRELRDRLAHLIRTPPLNLKALSQLLDDMPQDAGSEAAVVVRQARRAMVKVAKGNNKFKPLLRHTIARLIVLLEDE